MGGSNSIAQFGDARFPRDVAAAADRLTIVNKIISYGWEHTQMQ